MHCDWSGAWSFSQIFKLSAFVCSSFVVCRFIFGKASSMCINFDGMVTTRSVSLKLSLASEPKTDFYVFIFACLSFRKLIFWQPPSILHFYLILCVHFVRFVVVMQLVMDMKNGKLSGFSANLVWFACGWKYRHCALCAIMLRVFSRANQYLFCVTHFTESRKIVNFLFYFFVISRTRQTD